jgi:CheY-like chemotaxis protein
MSKPIKTIKPKILAIDDKKENLLALEAVLDDFQCDLRCVTSGDEGLKLILEHDFALALLDVQMPGMDGFEVAEFIRGIKKSKYLPIIFITALNENQEAKFKGYEAGAVDFLFKPLDPEILKSKVGIFLDLYKQKALVSARAVELKGKMEKALHEIENRKRSEKIYEETTHENSLFLNSDENNFSEIAIPSNMLLGFIDSIEKGDGSELKKQLGKLNALFEKGKLLETRLSALVEEGDFDGALDLLETIRVV